MGQSSIFISYSRANSDFVLKLARELKAVQVNAWLDQLDIPTGSRWDDEVESALKRCESFLIVLSPSSIASQNVKDEIGVAIDSGKRIVPILLEQCEIPFRLRRFQYVDFTKLSHAEGMQKVLSLLRQEGAIDQLPAIPQKEEMKRIPPAVGQSKTSTVFSRPEGILWKSLLLILLLGSLWALTSFYFRRVLAMSGNEATSWGVLLRTSFEEGAWFGLWFWLTLKIAKINMYIWTLPLLILLFGLHVYMYHGGVLSLTDNSELLKFTSSSTGLFIQAGIVGALTGLILKPNLTSPTAKSLAILAVGFGIAVLIRHPLTSFISRKIVGYRIETVGSDYLRWGLYALTYFLYGLLCASVLFSQLRLQRSQA